MQSEALPSDRAKLQRLIDLTAILERINSKISFGAQPSAMEYETLSEANREFGELLVQFSLRPPLR